MPRAGSYQLRIPDSQNWKLDMLKDGTYGLAKWREGFDLQVNSIWNGLGDVLEEMRRDDNVIGVTSYNNDMVDVVPAGASDIDWAIRVDKTLYGYLYPSRRRPGRDH